MLPPSFTENLLLNHRMKEAHQYLQSQNRKRCRPSLYTVSVGNLILWFYCRVPIAQTLASNDITSTRWFLNSRCVYHLFMSCQSFWTVSSWELSSVSWTTFPVVSRTQTNAIKTSRRSHVHRYVESISEASWPSEVTKANSLGIYSDGLLGWFLNVNCGHLFHFCT